MLNYLQKSNPYFDSQLLEKQLENSPFYTDNDSIQIHQRNLKGINRDKEIVGIGDDLGDNCKILFGGWIAPKLYFLEYAEKIGDVVEVHYHLRGKGIPKNQLTPAIFEQARETFLLERICPIRTQLYLSSSQYGHLFELKISVLI